MVTTKSGLVSTNDLKESVYVFWFNWSLLFFPEVISEGAEKASEDHVLWRSREDGGSQKVFV